MKTIGIFLGCVLFFSGSAVNAEPLAFLNIACELTDAALADEVQSFVDKYTRAKRRFSKRSRYRKHLERHLREVIEVFEQADRMRDCPEQRRVKLQDYASELRAL